MPYPNKKARWMKEFEDKILSLGAPSGKTDWDTATYLFNEGFDVIPAAHKYISSHPPVKEELPPPPEGFKSWVDLGSSILSRSDYREGSSLLNNRDELRNILMDLDLPGVGMQTARRALEEFDKDNGSGTMDTKKAQVKYEPPKNAIELNYKGRTYWAVPKKKDFDWHPNKYDIFDNRGEYFFTDFQVWIDEIRVDKKKAQVKLDYAADVIRTWKELINDLSSPAFDKFRQPMEQLYTQFTQWYDKQQQSQSKSLPAYGRALKRVISALIDQEFGDIYFDDFGKPHRDRLKNWVPEKKKTYTKEEEEQTHLTPDDVEYLLTHKLDKK